MIIQSSQIIINVSLKININMLIPNQKHVPLKIKMKFKNYVQNFKLHMKYHYQKCNGTQWRNYRMASYLCRGWGGLLLRVVALSYWVIDLTRLIGSVPSGVQIHVSFWGVYLGFFVTFWRFSNFGGFIIARGENPSSAMGE